MIEALQNKLDALKISGAVSDITENDFAICYHVNFAPDVTLSKIRARRDDLSLFFQGAPVDIETDRGNVIIKVSKSGRDIVPLYDFSLDITNGSLPNYELPLIIGRTEDGRRLFYDLVKMPHLLIAGATGSGKSVFMHNCILSALYHGRANLMLIDVKRVEFSMYENIPHLCYKTAYTPHDALDSLKALNLEMSKRYQTLQSASCRNIKEYKDRGGDMNYIIMFIDELADLMLSNKMIEHYIIKIAQLGRAAGIHLVVATQRPDATILSGLIRANIPTRVCFAVQKATDSRIVLDMSGAERLQGQGDGLFVPIGSKKPIHFQAPFISSAGLEKVIEAARHCND